MKIGFDSLLRLLAAGAVNDQLTNKLREVSAAVTLTGKKGKLSLELTIVPTAEGQVRIEPKAKVVVPEPDNRQTLFFVDDKGNLSREEPEKPGIRGSVSARSGTDG